MISIQFPNDSWRPVDPASVGVTGADAVALRSGLEGPYTPIFTITRLVIAPGDSVESLADDSASHFAGQTSQAQRLRRAATEPHATAPGVTQVLAGTVTVDGSEIELRRIEGFVGSVQESGATAVVALTVTCAVGQLAVVGPEFGDVFTSISGA